MSLLRLVRLKSVFICVNPWLLIGSGESYRAAGTDGLQPPGLPMFPIFSGSRRHSCRHGWFLIPSAPLSQKHPGVKRRVDSIVVAGRHGFVGGRGRLALPSIAAIQPAAATASRRKPVAVGCGTAPHRASAGAAKTAAACGPCHGFHDAGKGLPGSAADDHNARHPRCLGCDPRQGVDNDVPWPGPDGRPNVSRRPVPFRRIARAGPRETVDRQHLSRTERGERRPDRRPPPQEIGGRDAADARRQ